MGLQKHACYICNGAFTTRLLDEDGKSQPNQPKAPTRDHVLPRSLGGLDHQNILIAHQLCNAEKKNRMPTGCELLLRDFIYLDIGREVLLNTHPFDEYISDVEYTGVKQMLDVIS